jgi:prophage regulatory protein
MRLARVLATMPTQCSGMFSAMHDVAALGSEAECKSILAMLRCSRRSLDMCGWRQIHRLQADSFLPCNFRGVRTANDHGDKSLLRRRALRGSIQHITESMRKAMKRKEDASSRLSAPTSDGVVTTAGAAKLLRCEAVQERTGLSRTTLWRMERRGEFPKRVHLTSSLVAWMEDEVIAWIRSRRRGAAA